MGKKRRTLIRAAAVTAGSTVAWAAVQVVLNKLADRELERANERLQQAQRGLREAKAESARASADHEREIQEMNERHAAHMAELEELGARRKAATDPDEIAAIDAELMGHLARALGGIIPTPPQ